MLPRSGEERDLGRSEMVNSLGLGGRFLFYLGGTMLLNGEKFSVSGPQAFECLLTPHSRKKSPASHALGGIHSQANYQYSRRHSKCEFPQFTLVFGRVSTLQTSQIQFPQFRWALF